MLISHWTTLPLARSPARRYLSAPTLTPPPDPMPRTLFAAVLFLSLQWGCADPGTEPEPVPINQAPTAVAIPVQRVFVGDTGRVVLSRYFSDPDGDALTYTAGSSHPGLITASVRADTLLLAAALQGDAMVTVTATDPGGLSASQMVQTTVPNRHVVTVANIPELKLFVGDSLKLALGEYFSDLDGDALIYTVESWSPDTLGVYVTGDTLLLVGVQVGHGRVTVTAEDPWGSSATQFVGADVAVNERAVLEALYHATDGPNWKRSDNWLTDAPLDDWSGIRTYFDGNVRSLSLSGNGLTGSIPPQLARISHTVTAEGFGGSVGAEFLPREQVEQKQAALRPCFRGARVAGTAA